MKRFDLRVLMSILGLVAVTLACALPGSGNSDGSILRDDFSNSGSGWGTGTDTNYSVQYANEGLQLIVYSGYYITWSNPDTEIYENVHVDVSVKNDSTDPLAIFGIICHEQVTQSFYYLGVAADGYYTISKSQVGTDDVSFANGTSTAIPALGSGPFTMGADCGTGNLALYVNGQQIATAQDATYTSGKVGLFAWTDEQANGANVTFDDFVLTALPQQ
ncbi:MAG: hypothetical protein AB1649_05495 [Chloroflexota bacterium]